MLCEIKNNIVSRKVIVENNGNEKITISSEDDILPSAERFWCEGDTLVLTYGFKVRNLTTWERVKFLFGFMDIQMDYTL